MIVEVTN